MGLALTHSRFAPNFIGAFGILCVLTLGSGAPRAQTAPPAAVSQTAPPAAVSVEEQIAKIIPDMVASTKLKTLPPEQQRDAVRFVIGNMLYSVFHEMGHLVMSEMQMPVLGRMEDAADSFAIVAGIKLTTSIAEHALIDSGKGWFFTELSDRRRGAVAAYYDSHGMNMQRAYQIVCYMVGAHPEKFKPVADAVNLPVSRQTTCKDDYAIAAWSWEELLKPYLVSTGKPTSKIEVGYDEGKGALDVYARTFKQLRFLEHIQEIASSRYVWRRPLTMKMETCNKVNAWWSEPNAKVTVCYELVDEFVQLYLEFINDPEAQKRMQALKAVHLPR